MPPKPKAQTTRRSARADVRKGATAKPKAVKSRVRRAPSQLLEDLKSQRDDLAQRMEAKLANLDAKIAKVEARYEKSIKLAAYADVSQDDLNLQLEEAKRQQRLLRMALKAKR